MKKSDHSNTPISLVDANWEEHPISQWLSTYGRYLLWAVLALVFVLILIYRLIGANTAREERDFIEANNVFQQFENAAPNSAAAHESLDKLSSLLQKTPELHAKYDGLIAQILINRGDVNAATNYANLALERTQSEDAPFYTNYSQTTLLIAQKNYQEALNRSLALNEKMQESEVHHHQQPEMRGWGTVLFGYNLCRIALLQQILGLPDAEYKTWQEWKKFYNNNRHTSIEKMASAFTEGKVTLIDYIESRESLLKKQ